MSEQPTLVIIPSYEIPSYEADFCAWAAAQAAALHRLRPAGLDWSNLVEELDDMSRSEQRALESHLAVLLAHLLKWKYRSGKRTLSWETSIENSRDEIDELLKRSPSLRAKLKESLLVAYRRARRVAGTEMKLSKPEREGAADKTAIQLVKVQSCQLP